MIHNLLFLACINCGQARYSTAMHIAPRKTQPELASLLERFEERRELLPLKARLLKGMVSELRAAYSVGLPWRAIWRALVENGYEGSYRQFWRMAVRLTVPPSLNTKARKNLPATSGGKSVERSELRSEKQPEQVNTSQEKPEWQIQREELMARLDREAEMTRQREERLRPVKIFKPSPFVGRGEE